MLRSYVIFLVFNLLQPGLFGQGQKPNILWLTFEDTSPQFIGCYGNSKAKTPFMDSLALAGIRFTRAFSTGAVCSPSRTALITGMKTYTLGTGHHRSRYQVPDFVKGFPFYLKKAGYYCSNNEKTDYNVADPKAFIAEAWDESSGKAGWWNRKAGQPFFAVFNNMSSHQSRTMTNADADYEKMVLAKLPKHLQIDENEFDMPAFYRDSPAMRRNMARVYNSIALADHEMKQIFERLKKDQLLENTIVFVFADHGEGMPRVKTNGIGLGHQVPFLIWLPEKYRHLSKSVDSGQLLDFCDLPPTVLDLAEVAIPSHFQGKSIFKQQHQNLFLSSDRSDESTDLTRTVVAEKFVYTRVFMPMMQELRYLNYMDRGEITVQIRKDFKENKLNKTQKSILEPRAPEYLFDLENDPWQVNNLALSPKYARILCEMRTLLKNHLIEERDVQFLPEGRFQEVQAKETLYDFRKVENNYPIQKIIDIAMLSGLKSKTACRKQIEALADPNETVRYWAAMGLKSQDKANLKANVTQIEKSLMDESPLVVAVVASALSHALNHPQATQKLEACMLSENDFAAYLAIQGVMYQQNRRDFEDVITQFLALRKGQARFMMARNSAKMYQYILGKSKIADLEE